MGSVAKSYMRKAFLIYDSYEEMHKYLTIYEKVSVYDDAQQECCSVQHVE